MGASVIVWDIETVPDLKGFAQAHGHDGKSDDDIRAAMGDKFPKHIYHSIVCIGALIARQDDDRWVIDALGAPHLGERSETALISSARREQARGQVCPHERRGAGGLCL
jgi:3'-5' exonuclease